MRRHCGVRVYRHCQRCGDKGSVSTSDVIVAQGPVAAGEIVVTPPAQLALMAVTHLDGVASVIVGTSAAVAVCRDGAGGGLRACRHG